jgi:predicted GNAT family N-acyltransferase
MEIIPVKTQEQLDKCLAIRFKVFVDEQQVPPEEEVDEYDASPEACRHVLLLDEGRPLATGRWRFYDGNGTAKLQRVAVLRECRGKGLGKELILGMERQAKEAGAASAILDGQCQAEQFYRKLDYETVSSEPFLDAGILHVRMKKRL